MRYPKLRELKEAIRALIKGPYTSRFPKVPHMPFERFRGRPYFHEEECIGCTACAQVCPSGAIEFKDEVINGKAKRSLVVYWDLCIFCGQCQANCPTTKGIVLSREFDFATTGARDTLRQGIEKELLVCECCQDTIVPFDQYMWVAKKLGPLTFANASLILFYTRALDLASNEGFLREEGRDLLRSDRIKILCPRCRREAVIKS
ncbi:MAG: 4Fe-4S binding protein [Candidatus Omnitrophica bacterium]|nr:4Fe-4S binding protein [Candidatus Omnitrophota bacterium]